MLELLQDQSVQYRKLAAWTLGSIGQGAVEAIPALLVALRDTNEGVRKMARDALEKISPTTGKPGQSEVSSSSPTGSTLPSVAALVRHQFDEFFHPRGTEAVTLKHATTGLWSLRQSHSSPVKTTHD